MSLAAFPANSKTYEIKNTTFQSFNRSKNRQVLGEIKPIEIPNPRSNHIVRSFQNQVQNSGNYLGCEIFEDSGEVNGSTGADALGVFSGLEETGDTADGELEAGFAAP